MAHAALRRSGDKFGGADGASIVSRTRFADQAYAYLFHKITVGVYSEGEALPSENELCSLLGISRPVVRQALERLRADGLIESRRGAGSFVKRRSGTSPRNAFSEGRLRELLMNLEFRSVIEPEAAYLAAERRTKADLDLLRRAVDEFEQFSLKGGTGGQNLDFKFHRAITVAAGNLRFLEAISSIEYDIDHAVNLARYLVNFDQLHRARTVLGEHIRMLEAIEAQDAEAARQGMREHLEQARLRMMQVQPESVWPEARALGGAGSASRRTTSRRSMESED